MNCYEKLLTDEETYSINMFLKTYQTPQKAATNLAANSLSINTYITNTEKESKLRKTGIFFQNLRKMFMI